MGSTNLPALTQHCEVHASARHLQRQPLPPRDTRALDTPRLGAAPPCDKETKQREKFKLPLISSTSGTAKPWGQCRPKRRLTPREPQLSEHERLEVR